MSMSLSLNKACFPFIQTRTLFPLIYKKNCSLSKLGTKHFNAEELIRDLFLPTIPIITASQLLSSPQALCSLHYHIRCSRSHRSITLHTTSRGKSSSPPCLTTQTALDTPKSPRRRSSPTMGFPLVGFPEFRRPDQVSTKAPSPSASQSRLALLATRKAHTLP